MTFRSGQYDYMDLDDFEELLADKPRDEKWELIGGRVVKMMVGARWEHHFIVREVVSEGSVGRDRVEKWRVYQKLASLQHYVLVERDKPVIEVFDRTGDAWSAERLIEGLDAVLELSAIEVTLPLAEIYRNVVSAPA